MNPLNRSEILFTIIYCRELFSLHISISRYMIEKNLDPPILLYITPEAWKGFGYVLWEQCRQKSIVPVIIPETVHTSFRNNDHGIFPKLLSEWNFNKALRLVRYIQFTHILTIDQGNSLTQFSSIKLFEIKLISVLCDNTTISYWMKDLIIGVSATFNCQ